ncbi:glycine cleavage system aminomethyltransferase GcvT [Brevifollis gellanilyticus]|uniref:Aminomethyltransferase n=1 Tax=Brevifollis gellanilyticus TaxID=748831 RepID=A0A512MD43_9BACT|nr:glycine cleavage system aminomethyltransferase GcvT [Brevifollis gellanilyticus]GEP44660.1 aminomethyltransferase [Brevifollis gellanilyticus]
MSDTPLLRTPLFENHVALGAKMVPFAGWEMPVQYSGIVPEHQAVRKAVGVFDISHMGQFIVSGDDALAFLNRSLTNDVSKLEIGQGQYSLMLNDAGGVIDDLILYRTSQLEYFVVVNASMIDVDWAHLRSLLSSEEDVHMANLSDATAGLAVQGPKSRAVFEKIFGSEAVFPPHNSIFVSADDAGFMWLCGTGYTGEDGFEFFSPASNASAWFDKIVAAVREEGGVPCGLGARDTLRLEMGYPLNGNDLSPAKTPLEAGLGFFVAMEKEAFTGKAALTSQKKAGLPSKLAAFKMTGTAPPPRPHYPVAYNGEIVGEVASGTQSPSLSAGIGMVYLPTEAAKIGTAIEIEIRGRRFPAEIVKKPFYRKDGV